MMTTADGSVPRHPSREPRCIGSRQQLDHQFLGFCALFQGTRLEGITSLFGDVWCSHDAVYHCLSLLSAVGLQEKERNKGQKKSLTPLQQLEEDDFSEQPGADVDGMKTIQVR